MRIGIDCRTILDIHNGELAGVGHYTYFLIKKLLEQDKENQYFLFFYNKDIHVKEFEQSNVQAVYFPLVKYRKFLPFIYNHIIVPCVLGLYHLDIYHNPANVIPLFYVKRSVITIHDLAIYRNSKWFPSGQWFSKNFLVPLSIRKAKKIIAVSENTRNDLINIFKIDPEKIKVIYEGVGFYKVLVDEIKPIEKFRNLGRYFLYVGTLEPRKNLVRSIRAFAEFLKQSEDKDYKFVIAGHKGWKYEEIFTTITELNLGDKIQYVGYVSLEEKIYLIKNAFCFIFASLYEGFGLPILEAMYLGVPIITSNVSSIPEIIIDNAILVDPYNIHEIANGMLKVSSSEILRASLVEKGKRLSQNYRWQTAAKDTLTLYREMVN